VVISSPHTVQTEITSEPSSWSELADGLCVYPLSEEIPIRQNLDGFHSKEAADCAPDWRERRIYPCVGLYGSGRTRRNQPCYLLGWRFSRNGYMLRREHPKPLEVVERL
jgi:hypothetical protein